MALDPKPVTIRGVEYRSICAAAKVLDVTPATISEAMRRNRLDGVGLKPKAARMIGARRYVQAGAGEG